MSETKPRKILFLTIPEWLVMLVIIAVLMAILLSPVQIGVTHGYNESARAALRETYRELVEKKPAFLTAENGLITSCWLDELYVETQQPTPAEFQDLITTSKTIVTKSQTQVTFFPIALPATYKTNGFVFDQGDPEEYVLVPIHPATISTRNDIMLLDTPADLSQPQDAIWQKIREAHRTTNWPDIYLCRRNGELMRLALSDLDAKLPPE